MTKWIRADHALAEKEAAVAAERVACAEVARLAMDAADEKRKRDRGPAFISYAASAEVILRRIRARANSDPLEAVKAEARAEALREAAKECEPFDYDGAGDRMCKTECQRRILALIPTNQEGDR